MSEVTPEQITRGARALLDYQLSRGWDGASELQRSCALDESRCILEAVKAPRKSHGKIHKGL